jgi:hypothetical protein
MKIVYYKLSDAFIILFTNEPNSLNFAEHQVNLITKNFPKKRILLLFNKFKNSALKSQAGHFTNGNTQNFFGKNLSHIKEIDLKEIDISNQIFSSFFRSILSSRNFYSSEMNCKNHSSLNFKNVLASFAINEKSLISKRSIGKENACRLEQKNDCIIV